MKHFILLTWLLCAGVTFGQSAYEQGMGKAMGMWRDGKNTEAVALFERISLVEKNNWLPAYYVAFISTLQAFETKDRTAWTALVTKAQTFHDQAVALSPNNAELMVVQALIYTAYLIIDPMTNGMKYSSKVMEQYVQAQLIAPTNPRVVFSKAEFEMNGAKYWGTDTAPICERMGQSITLFNNFKPETPFHPSWGLDRAQAAYQACSAKK